MFFGRRNVIKEQLFNKSISTNYRITAPSRRTINFWYQRYKNCGFHSHRGGIGRPTIRAKKAKSDLIDDQSEGKTFISKRWCCCRGLLHQGLAVFAQKLENISSSLPYWTTAVRKGQENRVAFASLCKEKLQKSPNFLKRVVFSDE